MNKLEETYSDIKNKYFEIRVIDIYKHAGILLIFWLLLICLILFSITLFLSFDKENFVNISLISSIFFFIIVFFTVKHAYSHFYEKYSIYKDFIKSEQELWRGCRYILFLEKIKNMSYNEKEIINIIDAEIEAKEFDITKSIHGLILIPVGLMILNVYISKINDIKTLVTIIVFYLVLYYFFTVTSTLYRSKISRLKELKYFLLLKSKS